MMLLLLMLGIKLNMGPMFFLIWFVVFIWRLLGDGKGQ